MNYRSLLIPVLLALVTTAQLFAQDAAQIDKGKQVYTAQKCALCHSIAGKGNKKGTLDDVGSKLSAADIRSWVMDAKTMTAKTKATRQPPMKQFSLPAVDVDALVAYLSTLKGQ